MEVSDLRRSIISITLPKQAKLLANITALGWTRSSVDDGNPMCAEALVVDALPR
jgi:hypothetical protein